MSYRMSRKDVEVSANINAEVGWDSIVVQPHCLPYSQKAHSPAMEAVCFAGKPDMFLHSGIVEAELVQVGGRQ